MKKTHVYRFFVGLIVLTATAFGDGSMVMGQEKDAAKRTIQGVWITTITPRSCVSGEQVAPEFHGLLTFNASGTLAEIATGGGPATRSPGHGVWKRELGWPNYSMAFMFYRFGAGGVLVGSQRVRQDIELNYEGDEFSSTGTVAVIDLNGVVIGGGCSTSTGVRFE